MKRTLIYLTTITAAATMTAETLTPAQALARAGVSTSIKRITAKADATATTPARVISLESDPDLYVFSPVEGGLLLVSAESETPALIGYSENYRPGDELPPALEGMMRIWAAEIEALRNGKVIRRVQSRTDEDFAPIEPLCKTRWNQDSPYNAQCPILNGSRTYTGCVATAMAQVLKVYEYPPKCVGGTYSYYWNSGKKSLSLNFDDITLDWQNMLDSYSSSATQEQKDAVATLMQALGYATDMNYHTDGSGANGCYMAAGLARNFDYDISTIEYANRAAYSLSEWQNKVYTTLADGFPVYYDGVTSDEQPVGHAFVVDGYRSDGYFHLNWGWGGMSDGYFRLTALDPDDQGIGGAYSSAGFNAAQGAIFGLKKGNTTPANNIPINLFCDGGFRTSSNSVILGKSAYFSFSTYVMNCSVGIVSPYPGVIFRKSDGTEYTARSGSSTGEMKISYGYNLSYGITVPSTLTDGDYTIIPAAYSDNTQQYYKIHCNISCGPEISATVSNGTIQFHQPILPELSATIDNAPDTIYANKKFTISGDVEGLNSASYYGAIIGRLYNTGTTTSRAGLGSFIGSVDGNSTTPFKASFTLTSNIKSGIYDLALTDANSQRISNPVKITVISAADDGVLKASGLKCLNAHKNGLRFEVNLTASEGNFNGEIYIELHLKGDYNNYVKRLPSSEKVSISMNDTKTVTISGDFSEGIVGMDYTAYVYYKHSGEFTEAKGRQRLNFTLLEESSINEINADSNDGEELYYDLSGRRITKPQHGVFIRKSSGSQATKAFIR